MSFANDLQELLTLDYNTAADYLADEIVSNEYTTLTQKSMAFASRGFKILIHRCSNQLEFKYEPDFLKATHAIWTATPDHPVEGYDSFKDMVADKIEAKLKEQLGVQPTCRLDLLSLRKDGGKLIDTPVNREPIYEESVLYQAVIKLDWTEE